MEHTRISRLAKLTLSVIAGSGALALAQGPTTLVIPQGPLLPGNFGTWSAQAATPAQKEGSSLVQGKTADVLKEDGLSRSAQQSYTQSSKAGGVRIDALQFEDATGAVSAFTYLRSPEMKLVPQSGRVGAEEVTSSGRYLFRDGASVVLAQVDPKATLAPADLRLLAATLPKISGPKGAPPLLPTLLPSDGLLLETVHYSVGPIGYAAMGGTLPAGILGFEKSAEAATAEYNVHGGKGSLTLLLFPTPQIAGDRGRAVEATLNASGERAGTARLRREGPLVMLARGGFTPEEAKELLDSIHLRTEVTWNKPVTPEFHAEVRKTSSLLVSIVVFSGVLGLAAVLLGLFLGFGRAGIRVLMGKPAATEPEFLRLDLSGGPDAGAPR